MANTIPSWLSSFRITVSDECETGLFDSDIDSMSEFKFNDTLGGQIGKSVILFQDKYRILDVQIYTNNTRDKDSERLTQYYYQINLVVERL